MMALLPRATLALFGALALGACLGACADGGAPFAPHTTTGRGGGSNASALLVGQWSHDELFTADDGGVHGSRTIWRFDDDSSAMRSVIATDIAAGFADTVTARATWAATGTQLTVTYQPPDSGTVTFAYQVHLSTLTLGGVQFNRDE